MTEEKILLQENIFKQKNLNGIKTNMFFYNKYLNNPFYKYRVFHLLLEKKESAIIVFRKIYLKNTSIIRIIDFEGSEKIISKLKSFLNNIFLSEDCEYFDFLQYGIEKKAFYISVLINEDIENLIIPNYFEPLIFENKDILLLIKK